MPKSAARDLKSLQSNSAEARHTPVSQTRHCYASRQRTPTSPAADTSKDTSPKPTPVRAQRLFETSPSFPAVTGDQQAARRDAIKYLFVSVYGSPPKDKWKELGLIPDIRRRLSIPEGSWRSIYETCEALLVDEKADVTAEAPGKGRKPLIQDCTPQADVVYRCLSAGMSVGTTTFC